MTRLLAHLAVVFATALLAIGCEDRELQRHAAEMTGGDPARGRDAMARYGCVTCHNIPGVTGAQGLVGPPLNRMASRSFVGGVLQNTPENMIKFIQHPRQVVTRSAMPDLNVTDEDGRDMAAYLYTLR
jgi:cytochrome c2